jgi:NMD protein affecting ribosome stability and mRNA decay
MASESCSASSAKFMICFRCDNEDEFDLNENALIEQEYKGKTLWVNTPVMVCRKCGWQTLADGQLNALLKATKEVYEEAIKKDG